MGNSKHDLQDTTIGDTAERVLVGRGINQTNLGDVNVNLPSDAEDRTPVRLALLEWNMRRTQRSQDILSYAAMAVAVLCAIMIFVLTKAYGDFKTDIMAQNYRMEQRIIRLEDEIQYIQRQLDRERTRSELEVPTPKTIKREP